MSDLGLDLDLDLDPVPPWLRAYMAAMAAIVATVTGAHDALAAIVAEIKAHPEWSALTEAVKGEARLVLRAKEAEIRAAAVAAGPVGVPVAPVAPVAAPVAAPTPELPPLRGRFRKLPSGAWGAAIESPAQQPSAPLVGRRVLVEKRAGGVVPMVVLTHVDTVRSSSGNGWVHLVEADREGATPARERQAIPLAVVPAPTPAPAPAAVEAAIESIAATAPAVDAERVTVAPDARGGAVDAPHERTARTFIPDGPSVFDRPRAEREAQRQRQRLAATPTETRTEVRRLISERDFIAGAVAAGGPLQVSWTGGGSTTCGKVTDALTAIGRADIAPTPPSAEHHAGKAVDAMRTRDLDCRRVAANALPEGVEARWIIGRAMAGRGAQIQAGDAYGDVLCVVDLRDDGTMRCDGDVTIGNAVRSRFNASVAREALDSSKLTPWLQNALRTRHGAVKRGHVWYVPGGQADAVRALIGAVAACWGDHETIPVTTGPDLLRSLTRGLGDEVTAIEAEIERGTTAARDRARKAATERASKIHHATPEYIAAEANAAAERATVSARFAAARLAEIATVAARVEGYAAALGADVVAPVKARIVALAATLTPLTDDTSARAEMLELYEQPRAAGDAS